MDAAYIDLAVEEWDHSHPIMMKECIVYRREYIASQLRREVRKIDTTPEESPGLFADSERKANARFEGCCTCNGCKAYRAELAHN